MMSLFTSNSTCNQSKLCLHNSFTRQRQNCSLRSFLNVKNSAIIYRVNGNMCHLNGQTYSSAPRIAKFV